VLNMLEGLPEVISFVTRIYWLRALINVGKKFFDTLNRLQNEYKNKCIQAKIIFSRYIYIILRVYKRLFSNRAQKQDLNYINDAVLVNCFALTRSV